MPANPHVLAIVPARGGSKGFPSKNVAPYLGTPLIGHTIEVARKAPSITRLIASTDDPRTAEIARQYGAEVPYLRPAELAGDDARIADVVTHLLDWIASKGEDSPDYILILQPSSPMRTCADIEAAIKMAMDQNAPAVVSIHPASPHPYLARIVCKDGTMDYLIPEAASSTNRGDYPDPYSINGAIYLVRKDVFIETKSFQPKGTLPYIMPAERSVDIDFEWQLAVAEFLAKSRFVK